MIQKNALVRRLLSLFYVSAVIAIPVVYNACQSSSPSTNGGSSAGPLNCQDFEESRRLFKKTLIDHISELEKSNAKPTVIKKIAFNKSRFENKDYTLVLDASCVQKQPEKYSDLVNLSLIKEFNLKKIAATYTPEQGVGMSAFISMLEADHCLIQATENRIYESNESFFDDPLSIGFQSHFLNNIHANEAYPVFYHESNGIERSHSGDGATIVAVLDTGVNEKHGDLKGQVVAWSPEPDKYYYGIDVKNSNSGRNIKYENSVDLTGHGTHVGGLIAARTDDYEGIHGVSPYKTKILNLRVFFDHDNNPRTAPITNTATLITAIEIIRGIPSAHRPSVMNMSLGKIVPYGIEDLPLKNAIQGAVNSGIFVVASFGNTSDAVDASDIVDKVKSTIPAMYAAEMDGFISVAATQGLNDIFTYSLYDPELAEISAPGSRIYSIFSDNGVTGFTEKSGTSQSAPQVSASAALIVNLLKKHGFPPTPALIEFFLKHSSTKNSHLRPYVLDGNSLNLSQLAKSLGQAYPTVIGGTCF